MTETLIFNDLTPIEIPVSIEGVEYTLREASGDAACKYRNAMMACMQLADGKPVSLRGLADVEPLLVSLCLFVTETNKLVPLHVIKTWPSRVITPLFEKAKEISELGEGANEPSEEAVKNEQYENMDGSS